MRTCAHGELSAVYSVVFQGTFEVSSGPDGWVASTRLARARSTIGFDVGATYQLRIGGGVSHLVRFTGVQRAAARFVGTGAPPESTAAVL